ncbi:predicted protein [Sclerotinia sclerotiorum 1980 UF-70]|uniref:Uncharacterized protein n=1 Tax=Sclerotinia sclerotiorum (strain ATCC 18683 / 1980 / Ss-1) TaxID=665079 RepID=A7EZZ2_SCLS1|nr:predicted protein [Sclerotinia sclerotiorum 1980 UF-70]EDN95034.1 predicted protein [Sclerotinia sclerotiorum 1980 UF-70]
MDKDICSASYNFSMRSTHTFGNGDAAPYRLQSISRESRSFHGGDIQEGAGGLVFATSFGKNLGQGF